MILPCTSRPHALNKDETILLRRNKMDIRWWSRFQCTRSIASAYEDIRSRGDAFWFDYSSATSIECRVEALSNQLPDAAVADVEVAVVNSTQLLDIAGLESAMDLATNNFNCETLSHCQLVSESGLAQGWFGQDITFNGVSHDAGTFSFQEDMTPIILQVEPPKGMPGKTVHIRGKRLLQGAFLVGCSHHPFRVSLWPHVLPCFHGGRVDSWDATPPSGKARGFVPTNRLFMASGIDVTRRITDRTLHVSVVVPVATSC